MKILRHFLCQQKRSERYVKWSSLIHQHVNFYDVEGGPTSIKVEGLSAAVAARDQAIASAVGRELMLCRRPNVGGTPSYLLI